MAKVTPAGFKQIVERIYSRNGAHWPSLEFFEYKYVEEGRAYKGVNITFFDVQDTVVRVDFYKGKAEARVFTRDRAYHSPRVWSLLDLDKLARAIRIAITVVQSVEQVNGSESNIQLSGLVVGG